MILPIGVTEEILEKCKDIVSALTDEPAAKEIALKILQIIYSKGGGYSEKTIQAFAEAYLKERALGLDSKSNRTRQQSR